MTDTKQLTIRSYMYAPNVQAKLKETFTSERIRDNFVQSVISISGSDELLSIAVPQTVFNACLEAASMNLPISKNLGFAHIIGYKNNKKGITEAQFQIGARGFKELAQRSGQYLIIHQGDVRQGELAGRDRLTGELKFDWVESDEDRSKLPVVGYFSYFKLKNGYNSTLYMSKDEIITHGKRYSQAFKRGYGPWSDNFDAMALKTVSKLNISKNGPLSVELQKAIEIDQAVIRDDGRPEYIDGELADVGADDDKKAAIIAANQERVHEAKPTPPPVEDDAPDDGDHVPGVADTPKPEPQKSVKERAKDWADKGKKANHKGEQASLVNESSDKDS